MSPDLFPNVTFTCTALPLKSFWPPNLSIRMPRTVAAWSALLFCSLSGRSSNTTSMAVCTLSRRLSANSFMRSSAVFFTASATSILLLMSFRAVSQDTPPAFAASVIVPLLAYSAMTAAFCSILIRFPRSPFATVPPPRALKLRLRVACARLQARLQRCAASASITSILIHGKEFDRRRNRPEALRRNGLRPFENG